MPRRAGWREANVLHILGWAVLGLLIGAGGWLLRPKPRPLRLPAMVLLGVTGAVFGGFVAWMFWDFPGEVLTLREFITAPALLGDCLAGCGALVALSLTTGVAMLAREHTKGTRSTA